MTGMLVAPDTLQDSHVRDVLNEIFTQIDFAGSGSAAGSFINHASANKGITLPIHEAAIGYFRQ